MYLENGLTITAGLCGLLFVSVALLLYHFPPKKINHLYGYRTAKSMKNQERWDFAQKYSAVRMIESGVFLIILALFATIVGVFEENSTAAAFTGLSLVMLAAVYLFVRTQKAIDKKFKD